MWYDTLNEEWLKDEQDLHELLYEIADDNRDFFDIDDLIDEMYRPFEMFGVKFYSSEIIKKLDEMLYDQIREDIMTDWVGDIIYQLNRLEIAEGESIAEVLESQFPGLGSIVWKEQE